MDFRYWGDWVRASIFQKEDANGVTYPVELNGDYFFTVRYDQEKKWMILKDRNGINPKIDKELLNRIIEGFENKLKMAS